MRQSEKNPECGWAECIEIQAECGGNEPGKKLDSEKFSAEIRRKDQECGRNGLSMTEEINSELEFGENESKKLNSESNEKLNTEIRNQEPECGISEPSYPEKCNS